MCKRENSRRSCSVHCRMTRRFTNDQSEHSSSVSIIEHADSCKGFPRDYVTISFASLVYNLPVGYLQKPEVKKCNAEERPEKVPSANAIIFSSAAL